MLNVNFPTNKTELENKINKKNKFSAINFREVSLKENVHDFSLIIMLLINLTYET